MPAETNAPAIRLGGLRKRFGETLAVDGVDLELRGGEIHALLGENGAGKTTLMCMLAGLYRPDAGTIEVSGLRAPPFRSPRAAMAAGIGMVHQHFMLVPTLTVAENVLLGAARIPPWLRRRRIEREVQATADRLGLRVEAGRLAGELSVGEQQRVEILRVLARGARTMILDEPTAVLAPPEAEALFASLRRLASEGAALCLISHKLEELRQVADRLTVMRRGRVVASFAQPSAASTDELVAAMVGREVRLEVDRGQAPARSEAPLLVARGLRVRDRRGLDAVRGIDLELRGGELVGIAGVSGNGQRELFEALAGLLPAAAGELELRGVRVTRASARRRAELGLRYIPEDRQRTGSAPSLSVAENLSLRRYRDAPARRGPWLQLARLEPFCREQIAALQIAASSLAERARLLSGGNLQKLILARELDPAGDPARVVLAMHPTRGLDAWATAEARRLLCAARARGAAVLLCSEDLDEVISLADRVLVIVGGRIVHQAEGDASRADRLAIARAMAGGTALHAGVAR